MTWGNIIRYLEGSAEKKDYFTNNVYYLLHNIQSTNIYLNTRV